MRLGLVGGIRVGWRLWGGVCRWKGCLLQLAGGTGECSIRRGGIMGASSGFGEWACLCKLSRSGCVGRQAGS